MEGVQSISPQKVVWHTDYSELRFTRNSRCKEGTLTFVFLPERRRCTFYTRSTLPVPGGRHSHQEQEVETDRILYKETLLE